MFIIYLLQIVHEVQLSVQPSTPVPRRPLPVCLQCHL